MDANLFLQKETEERREDRIMVGQNYRKAVEPRMDTDFYRKQREDREGRKMGAERWGTRMDDSQWIIAK
jgi:hypothetical protein